MNDEIYRVSAAIRDRVNATLILSFSNCTMLRWLYPDASEYLHNIPFFFKNYCDDPTIYGDGTGIHIGQGVKGALLWKPASGQLGKEETIECLVQSVAPAKRVDTERVFSKLATYYPKESPYWYFTMLGVDPFFRRMGLAQQLILHFQELCDEAEMPWFCDATNEHTAKLYQSLGAEILGVAQHGSSPPFFAVGRQPRPRSAVR